MKNVKRLSLTLITGVALTLIVGCGHKKNDTKTASWEKVADSIANDAMNSDTICATGFIDKARIELLEPISIADIDIAKIAQDYDNYDPCEGDAVTFPSECEHLVECWKQPCLYLAPDVEHWLDSIAEITGIPIYDDYDDERTRIVNHAVHELRRYQTGERMYYPEHEVKDAFSAMFMGFRRAYNHADDGFYCVTGHYFHCFAAQAALLCPNVEFISETHSEDHQVGLLSCWTNAGPFFTAMMHQGNGRCTFQLVEENENALGKVFHLKNDFGKEYYLLTSGFASNEFYYTPLLYLYEKCDEVLSLVVKSEIPILEMMNGLDVRLTPEIIFNPTKRQWDLCFKDSEYWHKIEGTKSLYLHLDADVPYFEVH